MKLEFIDRMFGPSTWIKYPHPKTTHQRRRDIAAKTSCAHGHDLNVMTGL